MLLKNLSLFHANFGSCLHNPRLSIPSLMPTISALQSHQQCTIIPYSCIAISLNYINIHTHAWPYKKNHTCIHELLHLKHQNRPNCMCVTNYIKYGNRLHLLFLAIPVCIMHHCPTSNVSYQFQFLQQFT